MSGQRLIVALSRLLLNKKMQNLPVISGFQYKILNMNLNMTDKDGSRGAEEKQWNRKLTTQSAVA